MPVIVRRRLVNRWSIALAAIVVLTIGAAAFAIAGSLLGWLTRDQVSGIGGFLPFATLIAWIYVVMNWIETGGWSWSRIEDHRCLEVAREFLNRLTNGDFDGAFELTDPATFGDPQQEFARRMASWTQNQAIVSIEETMPSSNQGIVPTEYRVDGASFALARAEFAETSDQLRYAPRLRLVLRDDRYVVQAIETVVVGRECDDEEED